MTELSWHIVPILFECIGMILAAAIMLILLIAAVISEQEKLILRHLVQRIENGLINILFPINFQNYLTADEAVFFLPPWYVFSWWML